jgi:hypothetical protein
VVVTPAMAADAFQLLVEIVNYPTPSPANPPSYPVECSSED